MVFLDQVLEHVADDAPRQVVEGRCGRDGPRAAEDEGRHQVLGGGSRPPAGDEPEDDRSDGANNEEYEEPRVYLAG